MLALLSVVPPPTDDLFTLVVQLDRLDRAADQDAFEALDRTLEKISKETRYSEIARKTAREMRFTLDALQGRAVYFDNRESRIHIQLPVNDYQELITALRGLIATAPMPASVQFEIGRHMVSFTVHGERQPDYRPAALLSLAEAFELQYNNARRRVHAFDEDERAKLDRLSIELESMSLTSPFPLAGIDRLRAAVRLPDLFPRPAADTMLWFYASIKSLAAMAQALLLLGATPIRELTPEPHVERSNVKFILIENRGDNCTVQCVLCNEQFYTDATGENCSMDDTHALVPKCPKCGATKGG
jgi:hypothetical protein